MNDCGFECLTADCRNPFDTVSISYLTRSGTRVAWKLVPEITDPPPYEFQLQTSHSGLAEADDWVDVGSPVIDNFYAYDPQQRLYGKTKHVFYRIVLTTSSAVYVSSPVGMLGALPREKWLLAKEVMRKELLEFRIGGATRGYLLKRRLFGPRCPRCTDVQTDAVRDSACSRCYGTGKDCGYYPPVGCVWAKLGLHTSKKDNAANGIGQMSDTIVVPAERMLMIPLVERYDVWIDARTDDRYYVGRINTLVKFDAVPVIASAELHLAPATDVIYDLEIPEQVAELPL